MSRPEAHDDEARATIGAIVNELPADHPARAAYRAGADAIALTRLVHREDLVQKLNDAWQDWYTRKLRRQVRQSP
jgi:hypothetical protein